MLEQPGLPALGEDVEWLRAMCERTLRQNWIEGTRTTDRTAFAYTQPCPGHYPWQWFWDSCFAALCGAGSTRPGAPELETLLAAQREDGFIGHTIFWKDGRPGFGGSPTT